MAGRQGAQGTQEVTDGALPDGKQGGQSQDDHAEEGWSGEGACQRLEEGAGRFGQLLLQALQLTPGCAGLAAEATASFAVAPAQASGRVSGGGRRAASAT